MARRKKDLFFIVLVILAAASIVLSGNMLGQVEQNGKRARARELGIIVGILPPGPQNAITDVPGVKVGHCTVIRDDDIRTGITAILPHSGNLFQEKVPGAIYRGNAFGKLTGSTQVEELGEIETPVLLTNTLNVPKVADGLLEFMLAVPGNENVLSINPLVGETNDGWLNNIRKRVQGIKEVKEAIENAASGPVAEGSVGAGTGTVCFGFKGGIGTSSRVLPGNAGGYSVGVLVQTNFGGILQINGAPVGRELKQYYDPSSSSARDAVGDTAHEAASGSAREPARQSAGNFADGSCMIVVATDAPLLDRNLKRLAKRALLGLARTGSSMSNGSGDYVIAFSTAESLRSSSRHEQTGKILGNNEMSPLFLAVVEATEEAVYNSLLKATTVKGMNGNEAKAIPLDKVVEICEKYNVLHWDKALSGRK